MLALQPPGSPDEERSDAAGRVRQGVQGREGRSGIATCLLQTGQGGVAEHCCSRLYCQHLVDQRHALQQVLFSRIQVVALAQQIAQAEIVVEAAEVICTTSGRGTACTTCR